MQVYRFRGPKSSSDHSLVNINLKAYAPFFVVMSGRVLIKD